MTYKLIYRHNRLELDFPELGKPFYIDFQQARYQAKSAQLKNELIAKAIGIKKNKLPQVCDLTAGFGQDAYLLYCLGCKVDLVERSPIIAALLKDGLERAGCKINLCCSMNQPPRCHCGQGMAAIQSHGCENHPWHWISAIPRNECGAGYGRNDSATQESYVNLYIGEAKEYLEKIEKTKNYPEVIYFDPIFPQKSKTALAQKQARVLRAIVGDDEDSQEVFLSALKVAKYRVVVKRPLHANSIVETPKPNVVFKGKTIRFEVYFLF